MEIIYKSASSVDSKLFYTREQFLYSIYLSDKCGKPEDVINGFELMISKYPSSLNKTERNLLEKTIKQTIQYRQKKLNKLYNLEKEAKRQFVDDANEEYNLLMISCINQEKNFMENEIKSICKRIFYIVDSLKSNNLNESNIKNPKLEKETEVFYLKLKADLYKYLSQVEGEEDYDKYLKQANSYFSEAMKIANKNLDTFTSIYLSTILAYAKFMLNFIKNKDLAKSLLTEIYDKQKCKDILIGNIQVDMEVLNYLTEIKNLIIEINNE